MNFEYYYLCTKISSLEKRCKELEHENKLLKEDKSSLFDDLKSVLSKVKCGTDGSYYYGLKIQPPSSDEYFDENDIVSYVQPSDETDKMEKLRSIQKKVYDVGAKAEKLNRLSIDVTGLSLEVAEGLKDIYLTTIELRSKW